MDDLATIATKFGAALESGASADERLFLLHFAADSMAAVAALLLVIGFAYFASRRRDFEFSGLVWLFAAAFLTMAFSYGMAAWGIWSPDRWMEGTLKAAAAGMTAVAAFSLWSSLPHAIRLPSTRQLRRVNANLTREMWEHQRLLQQAQEEAARYKEGFEHASDGLALISATGRWLGLNDRVTELLGTTRAELLKRNPRQVLGDLPLSKEEASETQQLRDGRWLIWHVRWIHDGSKKFQLVRCVDATDQRNLEIELASVQEQLRVHEEKARQTSEASSQAALFPLAPDAELAEEAEDLGRHARHLADLGERLTELVGVDAETGLGSANQLIRRLEQAHAAARRYGHGFSVMAIAADPVETGAGARSPKALAILGAVLRAELRDTDAAARCDAERLCALLPYTTLADASAVADRIRRRLASSPILGPDGRALRVTCCIGIAQWRSGLGVGEVMREAGDALRSARGGGRDRVALGSAPSAVASPS